MHMQEFQLVSSSLNLSKISAQLAHVHQCFYGRSLPLVAVGSDSVSVQFDPVGACEVAIEIQVRCAGLEFELQFVDPDAIFELGAALVPGVPLRLQGAAFLHAAQPVWRALEKLMGMPVQLVHISGPNAVAPSNEALGMAVSVRDRLSGEHRHSRASIRALQPEGWRRLISGAGSRLISNGKQIDLHLNVSVVAETIDITWLELTQIEVGDALLLDASAHTLGNETFYLALGNAPIPGLRGIRRGSRLQMTHVDIFAESNLGMHGGNLWNGFMTINDNDNDNKALADHADSPPQTYQNAFDDVRVEVQLELGRLSLPISALRELAVGQVFDTQKALDGETVLLRCGERRLGIGQLIAIGERLGVRITSLELLPSASAAEGFAESAAKTQSPLASSKPDAT